jgi:threonine dehydratase
MMRETDGMNVIAGEPGINRELARELTSSVLPILVRVVRDMGRGGNAAGLVQIRAGRGPRDEHIASLWTRLVCRSRRFAGGDAVAARGVRGLDSVAYHVVGECGVRHGG